VGIDGNIQKDDARVGGLNGSELDLIGRASGHACTLVEICFKKRKAFGGTAVQKLRAEASEPYRDTVQ